MLSDFILKICPRVERREEIDFFHLFVPYLLVLSIKILIYANFSAYTIIPKLFLCVYFLYFIKDPGKLFLLVPPLLFLSDQAPNKMGFNEIYLGALSFVIFVYSVPHIFRFFIKSKIASFGLFFIFIFLFVNFFKATSYMVSLADWIRGLLPFLFIGMLWSAQSFLFYDGKNKRMFFCSFFVLLLLFSVRVIFVYYAEEVYKIHTYHFYEGVFTSITEGEIASFPSNTIRFFKQRVTMVLPESTNILVPLGSVFGAFFFIFSKNKRSSFFSGMLLFLSVSAVTLTVTRSMLLSVLIVLLIIGGTVILFYKKHENRLFFVFFIVCLSFYGTVVLGSLNDVYKNRIFVTISSLESEMQDENLNSRIDEYKKAFSIFIENPIFGAGLGVKHDMSFDTGHGYILQQQVGYIHNWIFYFLMVGGIFGLFIYALFMACPFFISLKSISTREYLLIFSVISLLGLYALFFAVFRLISFNIVMALCWGYMLTLKDTRKE